MAIHNSVVSSPPAQVVAAGVAALTLPAIPFWLAVIFGAVPTLYYTLLTIDYIRNWKPPTVQQQTVGAILAKITDLVGYDRPYLVAAAIFVVSVLSSYGIHIPVWVYGVLGAGGMISMHRITSAAVVLDKPVIAPIVVPTPPPTGGTHA
jgi:hypothetical protein